MLVRTLLPCLAVLAALAFLHGCYYLQQGTALWSTYSRARPIDELLRRSDLPPETRVFLELTLRIREFGHGLGLKDNANYTTYAEIGRDWLAVVVSASKPLAFQPHLWWHPIVGSVPYQGYFDLEAARAEAQRLREAGWDVWLRSVSAFSTLGWFRDPLFDFMRRYSVGRIADLLLHEQTHATIWVPGHVDFNESLAVVVGRRGALAFLAAEYGPDSPELREYAQDLDRQRDFLDRIQSLKNDLQDLYASTLSEADKFREKERRIEAFRQSLPPTLAHWRDRPLNNAVISTFSTYESGVDRIEAYLALSGGLEPMLRNLQEANRTAADFRADPWAWLARETEGTRSP